MEVDGVVEKEEEENCYLSKILKIFWWEICLKNKLSRIGKRNDKQMKEMDNLVQNY